jgi:hypothetical protein
MKHALPHLIESVDALLPAFGQLFVGNMQDERFHVLIVSTVAPMGDGGCLEERPRPDADRGAQLSLVSRARTDCPRPVVVALTDTRRGLAA